MLFKSYVGFLFSQEPFSLINFDRNLFLIDIDFCKPGVIQVLSLNFNLLEFFLEVESKDSNFSRKVLLDFSVFVFDENLSQSTENNQVQNVFD